jgi:hypothetical protein
MKPTDRLRSIRANDGTIAGHRVARSVFEAERAENGSGAVTRFPFVPSPRPSRPGQTDGGFVARKSRSVKRANTRAGNSRKRRVSRKPKAVAKKPRTRKAAEAEEKKRALEEIHARWDSHVRVPVQYDFERDEQARYLRNERAIRDEKHTFEIEGQGIRPAADAQYLLCKIGLPEGPNQSSIVIGFISLPSDSPVKPNHFDYYNTDCRGIPGECGNRVCPRAKPEFPQPLLSTLEPKFREFKLIGRDQKLLWKGRSKSIEHQCTFPNDPVCKVCTSCREIINADSQKASTADDRLISVSEVARTVKRSAKTVHRRAAEWGEPDEPGGGSRARRWKVCRVKPILALQFPNATKWIDDL